MEDGKGPISLSRGSHTTRGFPRRLLRLLVLFLVMCCTFSLERIQIIRYVGVYNVVTAVSSSLVPCNDEEMRNLDHWINPPISDLMHNMSDHELLLKASSVPRLDRYSFNRNSKIAFMFLTKGHLPLYPLWDRFFKGHEGKYSIYIHSSPLFEADFPASSVFYKRQIPSQVSEWGKMSICDAERRLLANAMLDISNEWFVLLSESCIPLHNFTVIHNYITRSKHSFIASFDDPGPHGKGRYNESMLLEININQWRKGSQWFEINRDLARCIVGDKKFYSKFFEFCKPPCYVDEHYFPTMLSIEGGGMLANRSVTWVDWSRGGPHPATFGGGDITEEFLKGVYEGQRCLYNDQFSSVCYLFARKFSPSALEALFLIAPKFLGF